MRLRMCMEMTPSLRMIMECPLCEADIAGVEWTEVAERAIYFATHPDYSYCPHCCQSAPVDVPDDAVGQLAALVDPRGAEWKRRVDAWRRVLLKKMGFWVAKKVS